MDEASEVVEFKGIKVRIMRDQNNQLWLNYADVYKALELVLDHQQDLMIDDIDAGRIAKDSGGGLAEDFKRWLNELVVSRGLRTE